MSESILALGRTPVTSSVKSIPPDFIVTAPVDTAKLSELKLAIPLVDVVALPAFTVTVVPVAAVDKPVPPFGNI